MPKLSKPIFIIGTGRCGSTLFHDLFSRHPQLAWISGFSNHLPQVPLLNHLVLAADSYGLSQKIMRRFTRPSEAIYYWEHIAPGITSAVKDLKRIDLHERVKNNVQSQLTKLLSKKRHRLLHKFTGWPRTEYLTEIFPDAKFIHIYRDGRAVAHSFFTVKWWDGWKGPENWICGPLSNKYQKEWNDSNNSFLTLAAIQWKIFMDSFQEAKADLTQSQIIELKYEDFAHNPMEIFNQVLEFCELEPSDHFTKFSSELRLSSQNDKWRKSLSAEQQNNLQRSLADHLVRYGYEL